ncbi:Carboxypeptidase S1 [Pseudohyphozyma bogoriensis]|nr:Carboxypeptidase S1 [Pseudohyphozyma bogoriensis]
MRASFTFFAASLLALHVSGSPVGQRDTIISVTQPIGEATSSVAGELTYASGTQSAVNVIETAYQAQSTFVSSLATEYSGVHL